MPKPFLISFAGPIGSSKTPIAHYLSCALELPVFDNDAIRSEVAEDCGHFDETEYLKRRDTRLRKLLKEKKSFIYSTSVDRAWSKYRGEILDKHNYRTFLISINISKTRLKKLCLTKNYHETLKNIDENYHDHLKFLKEHQKDINLHITDATFPNRLEISLQAVKKWLAKG